MFDEFKLNIKTISLSLVLFLFILIISFSSVVLADVSQTNIDDGSSETITTTLTKNHTLTAGGNTSDNLLVLYSTDRWAAFYGNISGNLMLGDSSNDIFYMWTVTNFTNSVLYASIATISDWSNANIEAGTVSHQENYLKINSNDNFTNTFNYSEEFNSSSLTESNTLYSKTNQNGVEGNFKTYSLHAITENTPLWAVKIREDDSSFISGRTVDYQLLVPSNESKTYKFYLELY